MAVSAASFQFGPFSERFEKIQTLFLDPGFSLLLARDRKTEDLVRLQLLHLPSLEGKETLPDQWEAIKACRDSLWIRPQEWLEKNHYGILLSWVPPGRNFNEIAGTLPDDVYLAWLKDALKDLAQLHHLGLLHLAQNEKSWILFKAEEERGEEILGLSDVGLLTEVPLGQKVTPAAMAAVAPEILRGQAVDARADLYSLACLLLRQRSAHEFQNLNSLKENLDLHWRGGMVEWVPESASLLHDLLRAMLQPDPEDRPADAREVLRQIDPYADIPGEAPAPLPDWARKRIQGRRNTLILNTIHTLIDSGEAETSAEMLEALSDYLTPEHEVYLRYLQARLARLQGDKEGAKEFRRQTEVKSYTQPDPKLKTLLALEEARVCREEGKTKDAVSHLDQAWEIIHHYPESSLQVRVLYERGQVKKELGDDVLALQELQEAYERIPPGEPHPWKAEVYAELAELLASYGRPSSALPLMEEALAVPEEDPRALAARHLQAALVYVSLGDWQAAQEHFSEAKSLFSSLKDLKSWVWASAQEVRLYLAEADFLQARRELRALKSRNRGRGFHSRLLELLEIRYWLDSGESLGSSTQKILERIRRLTPEDVGEGFFRDLGWPLPMTSRLYEQTFQRFRKYAESAAFAHAGAELEVAMAEKLRAYGYPEEARLGAVKGLAPAATMKAESLLEQKEEGIPPEAGETETAETTLEKVREQVHNLELRLAEAEALRVGLLRENARQAKEIRDLKGRVAAGRELEKKAAVKEKPAPPEEANRMAAVVSADTEEVGGEEKNTILEVLRKYKGNKSLTAKELGMHRRTLFQKLKKYGLENLEFLPSREEILAALEACEGNRSIAAKRLGLSRSTFYRRLKELGI